jgi:hypothetical protein
MNKLACIAIVLAFVSFLPAILVPIKPGDSYARIIRNDSSVIELQINLSAISIDTRGRIMLPGDLDSFVRQGIVPTMVFHLALPPTGDYLVNVTEQHKLLDVPIPQGYISPSETVRFSEPYWLRDVRGVAEHQLLLSQF